MFKIQFVPNGNDPFFPAEQGPIDMHLDADDYKDAGGLLYLCIFPDQEFAVWEEERLAFAAAHHSLAYGYEHNIQWPWIRGAGELDIVALHSSRVDELADLLINYDILDPHGLARAIDELYATP